MSVRQKLIIKSSAAERTGAGTAHKFQAGQMGRTVLLPGGRAAASLKTPDFAGGAPPSAGPEILRERKDCNIMEKKKERKNEVRAEKKKWIRNIFIGIAAMVLFRYFRNAGKRESEDAESD